jgi:tripartite-type tricarboxylate transporter receptor subunit TctC
MGLFARSRILPAGAALALAAAATVAPCAPAFAQSYPSRPIRVILPFAGGTDAVARLLSAKMSPAIGQQLVPEPRLGAGGNIAHEFVAKAPPDGYTLLMAAPPLVINPHLNKVSYDPLRDLVPIALLTAIPNVLVVHPSVPAKSIQELIALAHKNPGKLTYASGGVGSSNHLAGELLKSLTKADILHVPYKSATIALTGALAHEVDIVIVASSSVAAMVRDGRMRALAVLDSKRVDALPGVPTMGEVGLPQLVVVNWYILLAPAGTPKAIVDLLNREAVKAMNDPETRARLANLGGDPATGTPEQAAQLLRREYDQWGRVIREAGIKAE